MADFSDAYIIGRGARVVFDSPSHIQALGLFTDASHAPVDIDKSAAVSLNAAGTASSLSQGHTPKKSTKKAPAKGAAPAPAQPISDKIRCRTVVQVPHIPTITQATPGSRSVQLQWSYPLLDPRDCAPSTYTVAVQLLSTAAPPPPAAVTVQGQDGVNLTGLFPDTRYRITVTAYLNGRGTPSAPVEIATGPEGPAAPTNVHASTDSAGNWTITWNSCGGVAQGCVPSATWSVIPSFCDGAGLASAPATMSVAGDPTQHSFRATFPGNDSVLGRGLKFQVEGIGTRGTVGTPGTSDGCAFSWRPPVAGGMTLTASQPGTTTLGGSTTTTVNLDLGDNPVRAAGGVGAQVTFRLSGPDGTKTVGPVTFRGASQHLSGRFSGVQAGANYSASAIVSAPKHPESRVTVGPATVTTRAAWPTMTVDASCPSNPGPIVLNCTLTVKVNGLSSAAANGELFSFVDTSRLQCGSTARALQKDSFDPANDSLVENVSLLTLGGSCSVSVALVEAPGSKAPLVFGGTTSPVITHQVDLANASTLDANQGDFAVGFDNAGGRSNVRVRYQGGTSDSDVSQITTGWTEQVFAPNGTGCGSDTSQPTHAGIEVAVSATCVNRFGGQTSGWTVKVGYQDTAGGASHSFTYQLSGGPPTYQPCTVAASDFTATWAGTAAAPAVGVTYSGGAANLAGCSNWIYVLKDTTGKTCGSQNPGTPSTQEVGITDTCSSTRTNAWTVTVGYIDTAGDQQATTPIPVGGTPP